MLENRKFWTILFAVVSIILLICGAAFEASRFLLLLLAVSTSVGTVVIHFGGVVEDILHLYCLEFFAIVTIAIGGHISQESMISGPVAVLGKPLLAGFGLSALYGICAYTIEFEHQWRYVWGSVFVSLALIMILPICTCINGASYANYLAENAPEVTQTVDALFKQLDSNNDGLIEESELSEAIDNWKLKSQKVEALSHTRKHLDEVGHVIDSYTVDGFISTGKVVIPTERTCYIYGVSKADVDSYETRLAEKYKHWR